MDILDLEIDFDTIKFMIIEANIRLGEMSEKIDEKKCEIKNLESEITREKSRIEEMLLLLTSDMETSFDTLDLKENNKTLKTYFDKTKE